MHRSLDDPKLGTILLHRLGNVRGTTISVTTAQAPKSAQKSYEKGYELVQKGRFEEAEGRFVAAITDYPKFAVAWFALGQVQHRLNKSDEAKRSYLAAAQADSHYLSPFDQLALLSAEQGKWEDAAKYSKQVTDLNPVEFPSSFWYSALANYNLKNDAEAEKSAQALIKLDSRRRFPQAETMLAEFAEKRGDLKEAAAHLQAFLSEAPNSPNADVVKQQLSNLEEARATAAKSSPALAH
jgi:tetratricopeptide (TPR) repeat protein